MSLILHTTNQEALLFSYAGNNKDTESRLRQFTDWMDMEHRHWYQPDLAAYRDYLLDHGKTGTTVSAHLSTIRAHYRRIIRSRDVFYSVAAPYVSDPVQAKTLVDEMIQRIENAIHPDEAPVRVIVSQDKPDDEQIRLTPEQATRLLRAPGRNTLLGKRDTAMIATLLCTGIREQELADLQVGDHAVLFDGHLALHVREGKGGKERVVPYGGLDWAVILIDEWLDEAEIEEGPIFRGIIGGPVSSSLSVRAIRYRLNAYPVSINGEMRHVKPHDCRRSYARRMYDTGADPVAIQQNLGHSDLKTTLLYIGRLDVERRRPSDLWQFQL